MYLKLIEWSSGGSDGAWWYCCYFCWPFFLCRQYEERFQFYDRNALGALITAVVLMLANIFNMPFLFVIGNFWNGDTFDERFYFD